MNANINNPGIGQGGKDKDGEMKKLLAKENLKDVPKVGDLVEGKVIHISKKEVHLDIDGITSGVIRGPELHDESDEYSDLKVGDTVAATVLDIENEKGEMELSFRYAGHKKAWDNLNKLMQEETVAKVKVLDANKGGLIVKLGKITGFLPVSQLSPEHYPRVEGGNKSKILEKLKSLVGQLLDVKVITAAEPEEKLIVSEKETLKEKQEKVISQYKVGNVIEGKINGITNFGAFVEFGEGLEGLVHISELAWQRIDDPRDVVKVGDKVKAEIIGIEDSRISLSVKKLLEDPWKNVAEKYKVGQIIPGKILKINPFGLFVELDNDIHGLCHISELSRKPVESAKEIAKEGDILKFKILSIEPAEHRLGLSIRAIDEPAKEKRPVIENSATGKPEIAPEVPEATKNKKEPEVNT